jgi:hypothetical protein
VLAPVLKGEGKSGSTSPERGRGRRVLAPVLKGGGEDCWHKF